MKPAKLPTFFNFLDILAHTSQKYVQLPLTIVKIDALAIFWVQHNLF